MCLHLGTPRFGTNTAGTQVWAWTSDAFGNGAPSGSVTVNLRMPEQYYDSQSGLFYNWNRYYNPAIGRYISSDPIGLGGGLNTFNYVEASPVMYTDPEGLQGQSIPVPRIIPGPVGVCTTIIDWLSGTSITAGDCVVAGENICPDLSQNANTADEADKAGRKVSEKAKNAKAPGACTPGQHDELQKQVHKICDLPRKCDIQGLSSDEIQARANINIACAQARDKINNICFYGGDKVHRDQAIDAWNTAAKCQGKLL